MMNKIKIILVLAFLAIKSNAQIILPFELLDDKYILLKLPMPNSDDSITYYFDTGAAAALIDKTVANRYNLKSNHSQDVTGAGGVTTYEMILNHKILLTKNDTINNVNIILKDLTPLTESLGKNFDGVIGYDIIKNFYTKVDFKEKKISLFPFSEPINTDGYREIPFTFKNDIPIPQFPVTIELQNGEKLKGDIFFDSGAGITLSINAPFTEQKGLFAKMQKTITKTTTNLNNTTVSNEAMIKSLTIGDFEFKQIPIMLASDKAGVSSYDNYLGILGSEIINRFDIILDYKNQKLYLKTNYLFNNPFPIPVSPIQLKLSNDKVFISQVVENSEAYKKGLRVGQRIVSINNQISKDLRFYRKILVQENRNVKIKYADNNGKIGTVNLKLLKLL